jgi:choline dehydrogenase-like flavoprotein
MKRVGADLAIVGSGISALLAAWASLRAGRTVIALERGEFRSHALQLEENRHSGRSPGARPNHEVAPGSPDYPWTYAYGVGGSSLHWPGNTPRFVAEDFRMRSEYGVMSDWPIGFDELLPWYLRAEQALGIAGAPHAPPGVRPAGAALPDARALPAHALSPMDRLVLPPLGAYGPLPQARPSAPIQGRPACCGSAACELCPVDSRFSVLNGLRALLDHPRLMLRTETVAARLILDAGGRQVDAVEAIDSRGERTRVTAKGYVVAAGGLENPALLLRSGLGRDATGRYLFDHGHTTLLVRIGRSAKPGHGQTPATGMSHAFLRGRFREHASGAVVTPFNPGGPLTPLMADALKRGHRGSVFRREALAEWRRIVPLDVLTEDVPQAARRVTLSPTRDELGLPLVRIAYPRSTRYELDGIERTTAEIGRRLRGLGVREVRRKPGPAGGHSLGTCRMGSGPGAVVDRDLRHLDVENLWVTGGSAFPTYSPAHPTLTIAALALRLGATLEREL